MKRGLILCLVVLGALIGFGVTTSSAAAADTPVTVAPGATVRIPIRLWCLDFGKPFPTAIAGPVSRPPDAALLALQAAIARGATESDPYQTQLAIWRAADGTFHDVAGVGHVLAQQIYSDSLKLTVSPVPTNTPGIGGLPGRRQGHVRELQTDQRYGAFSALAGAWGLRAWLWPLETLGRVKVTRMSGQR